MADCQASDLGIQCFFLEPLDNCPLAAPLGNLLANLVFSSLGCPRALPCISWFPGLSGPTTCIDTLLRTGQLKSPARGEGHPSVSGLWALQDTCRPRPKACVILESTLSAKRVNLTRAS